MSGNSHVDRNGRQSQLLEKKNLQNVNPPEFWSANVPNVREHTMAILNDITIGHTALLTRKICQIML